MGTCSLNMLSYLQKSVSVRLWVLLVLVFGMFTLTYVRTRPIIIRETLVNQTPTKGLANVFDGVSNMEPHIINTSFSCIEANFQKVKFPMCLYPSEEDTVISKSIRNNHGRLYEITDVSYFFSLITEDMGVIDIGANLGTYTLPAAHTGHQVIAVEMVPRTAAHLRASITKGGITNKVTLINSAVSNKRTKFMIGHSLTNQGDSFFLEAKECEKLKVKSGFHCDPNTSIPTILLDDLTDQIHFKVAALKIDVQGAELFAFQNASRLFDLVRIEVVLIEWVIFSTQLRDSSTPTKTKVLIENLANFFLFRNYAPFNNQNKDVSKKPLTQWPYNVIFKLKK